MMTKTLADKVADADMRGGNWLAKANEATERGESEKAERLYEKAQFWLDRANRLLGNN